MLGSLGLSGMGSILSLHRLAQGDAEAGKPTTTELRHQKGIGSGTAATEVLFDLTTGGATVEASGGPTAQDLGYLAQLPEVGTFTRRDCETVWRVAEATAERRLKRLGPDGYRLLHIDHKGARGTRHYTRTAK